MNYYELIRSVARQLMQSRKSAATGGSTTTLVDSNLDAPNDFYNGGLLFIDQTIPVIKKITDWNSTTFTFTFATGTAVAASTVYTVVDERYPLDVIKNSINQALIEDVGAIMLYDESLTPVDEQERYDLPGGVVDVRRIEIGTEDEGWNINYQWKIEGGQIRFYDNLPTEEDTIRIHYVSQHPELEDLDDDLDNSLNVDMIIHAACVYAINWRITKVREGEPELRDKLSYHETKAMFAKSRMGNRLLNPDPFHTRY